MKEERVSRPQYPSSVKRRSTDKSTALPDVSIPYFKQLSSSKVSQSLDDTTPPASSIDKSSVEQATSSAAKSRLIRKDSLDDPQVDPWASPAISRNKTSAVHNDVTPTSNSVTAARPILNGRGAPPRTTSAFTTNSERPVSTSSTLPGDTSSAGIPSGTMGGGWGSYDNPSNGFPSGDLPGGGGAAGFGSGGDDGGVPEPRPARTLGRGKINSSRGVEETVTVALLPEKEGMFMFQHRNYEVKSARRASTVIRRYSDFVWLLDCLHKRYPFRQLPLLPPKRVAGKLTLIHYTDLANSDSQSTERISHPILLLSRSDGAVWLDSPMHSSGTRS